MSAGSSVADSSSALLSIIRRELPAKCDSAVDLGCGIGQITARLADFIPRVVGVDSDPVCIATARASAERSRGLTFRVGHAEKLGECLGSETFDLILSTFVLHHCENLASVVQGLRRYLRPGGRLIVIDLFAGTVRGFYRSAFNQLIVNTLLNLPGFRKAAMDFGVCTPLHLLLWRLTYAASAAGRSHMRSDFERGLPPPLLTWRHAFSSALPHYSERILPGGIVVFTWTNSAPLPHTDVGISC